MRLLDVSPPPRTVNSELAKLLLIFISAASDTPTSSGTLKRRQDVQEFDGARTRRAGRWRQLGAASTTASWRHYGPAGLQREWHGMREEFRLRSFGKHVRLLSESGPWTLLFRRRPAVVGRTHVQAFDRLRPRRVGRCRQSRASSAASGKRRVFLAGLQSRWYGMQDIRGLWSPVNHVPVLSASVFRGHMLE